MGRPKQSFFHNGSIGFLLVYVIPITLILCAWFGAATGFPNAFAFLPIIIVYLLIPLINVILSRRPATLSCTVTQSGKWRGYYGALPVLGFPAQLLMLFIAGAYFSSGVLSSWGSAAWLFSTGIFSSLFAITLAHELIHSKQPMRRLVGGMLLTTVSFGTFKIVHLRIHHRFVATPYDFATARRGQSIYGFWWQSMTGNFSEALRYEHKRLDKSGKSLWQSELVCWYGFSLLWLMMSLFLWGWLGIVFFIGQSFLAIMKLEWVNYLQHYGLIRKTDQRGQHECVQAHHSWSQEHFVTNLFLLNLMRHGDHHIHPQHPYQTLEYRNESPVYPYDFSFMFPLTLVPALFRRFVHPVLEQFQPKTEQAGAVILITGASTGIGRKLVIQYLKRGYRVAAVARQEAKLAKLHQYTDSFLGILRTYPADVTESSRMEHVVTQVEQDLGSLDMVIANAGIGDQRLTAHFSADRFQEVVSTNLMGVVNTFAPAITSMMRRGRGQLVAISSLAAVQSLPRLSTYGASKAAINHQLEGLYWDLKPHGIFVTTVCPGFIDTDMTADSGIPRYWLMAPEKAAEKIIKAIDHKERFYCFPFWLYHVLLVLKVMPDFVKGFVFSHVLETLFPRPQKPKLISDPNNPKDFI